MTLESFRVVFEPGTRLSAAWRACEVELAEPRYPPWHAYRPDGVLVITVWRNDPNAGRWVQWNPGDAGFRLALREPGSIPGESEQSLRKLRSYNQAVETAARAQEPIIVLVLNHRQTDRGQYIAGQRGAAGPAEAWSAWIGAVRDGGNFPYSVVSTQQYPQSPFDGAA